LKPAHDLRPLMSASGALHGWGEPGSASESVTASPDQPVNGIAGAGRGKSAEPRTWPALRRCRRVNLRCALAWALAIRSRRQLTCPTPAGSGAGASRRTGPLGPTVLSGPARPDFALIASLHPQRLGDADQGQSGAKCNRWSGRSGKSSCYIGNDRLLPPRATPPQLTDRASTLTTLITHTGPASWP
jgi:hypothetical protein